RAPTPHLTPPTPPPPRSPTLLPSTTLFRSPRGLAWVQHQHLPVRGPVLHLLLRVLCRGHQGRRVFRLVKRGVPDAAAGRHHRARDRKSTRLNSSHEWISYAVLCLQNKQRIV